MITNSWRADTLGVYTVSLGIVEVELIWPTNRIFCDMAESACGITELKFEDFLTDLCP